MDKKRFYELTDDSTRRIDRVITALNHAMEVYEKNQEEDEGKEARFAMANVYVLANNLNNAMVMNVSSFGAEAEGCAWIHGGLEAKMYLSILTGGSVRNVVDEAIDKLETLKTDKYVDFA